METYYNWVSRDGGAYLPHATLNAVSADLRGKDEKFRMTNLEWGVDFFSLTNLVKTS